MTIKNTRARKLSKIGNYPSTFAAISGFIPDDVWHKLSSKDIASLVDAMQDLAQNSKAIEVKEILENGGVWDNAANQFCELMPKNKAAA